MNFTVPMLIDGIDNKTQIDYDAWPDRIHIVDENGKIAYNGARGPRGLNPLHIVEMLDALTNIEPVGKRIATWGILKASL
jgi:hypothetical protein